jgi:hypothetical protein
MHYSSEKGIGMILGVSVGRDPTFTKDMFGSRLKSGLYLDRIRTDPGENLFWVQTLLPGPIQAVPVEGFCSVLGICSDPDQNQDVLVRIRTGAKRT